MSKTKILTENKILRLSIDESWSSNDFIHLFDSLNFLYKILIQLNDLDFSIKFYEKIKEENKEKTPDFKFEKMMLESGIYNEIKIIDGELYKKLNYSSTSNNSDLITDFRQEFTKTFLNDDRIDKNSFKVSKIKYSSPGFADLVGLGKVIEQIFDLIKYYFPNKESELKNSLLEQDIISKKIENLKAIGFSEKELKKFLDIRNNSILNLKNLKLSDKITKIEIKELE